MTTVEEQSPTREMASEYVIDVETSGNAITNDKTCIAALLKKVETDAAYIEALEKKLNISR